MSAAYCRLAPVHAHYHDAESGFPSRPLARRPRDCAHRAKIRAVIDNAHRIQALREAHGSFAGWLDAHHPRPPEAWIRLFRKNFRFTGGLIVNEFLMSLGYLAGAHEADCPVFTRISALSPPWARAA